jgi:hypothetical protein
MLPDPRFGSISILRLGKTDDDSRTAWASMPTLEGANRLGRLLPTTKMLAAAADGTPLLVGREYGQGRVLAFAADSTWRWVMQGAGDQHRRFWRSRTRSGSGWRSVASRRARHSPSTPG